MSVSKQMDDIYDTKRGFSSFYGDHDLATTQGFGKKTLPSDSEWERVKGIRSHL